jgi:ABC-2 type transport system permease protein
VRRFLALLGKELRMFFAAPLVYFVGGVFLALAGYYFYTNLNAFITFGFGESIVEHLWQRLFNDVVRIVITVIPLITMRVYAEEKNLGTIELLYTAPLRDWEILASKYLACLGVVVVQNPRRDVELLVLLQSPGNEFTLG